MQVKRWIIGILGVWLIVAVFLTLGETAYVWSNVIAGAVIAVVGLVGERGPWAWASTVLGVWTFVAAFIPPLITGTGLLWNSIIVGALVLVAALAMGVE